MNQIVKKYPHITEEVVNELFEKGLDDRKMADVLGCSPQYVSFKRYEYGLKRPQYQGGNFGTSSTTFGRIKGHTWDTQLNGKFEEDPRACERDYIRYCGYVAIEKKEAVC
jgi:hypothetical protein